MYFIAKPFRKKSSYNSADYKTSCQLQYYKNILSFTILLFVSNFSYEISQYILFEVRIQISNVLLLYMYLY